MKDHRISESLFQVIKQEHCLCIQCVKARYYMWRSWYRPKTGKPFLDGTRTNKPQTTIKHSAIVLPRATTCSGDRGTPADCYFSWMTVNTPRSRGGATCPGDRGPDTGRGL